MSPNNPNYDQKFNFQKLFHDLEAIMETLEVGMNSSATLNAYNLYLRWPGVCSISLSTHRPSTYLVCPGQVASNKGLTPSSQTAIKTTPAISVTLKIVSQSCVYHPAERKAMSPEGSESESSSKDPGSFSLFLFSFLGM